ncbi:fused MFS/spermidine synthase [Vibrio sp.]|nr:fused MFS/spermidine synthase [Vibrio sp.]
MGKLASWVSLIKSKNNPRKKIYQQASLYQNLLVVEQGNRRYLSFITNNGLRTQSCQFNDEKHSVLSLPYAKMALTGLLLQPHPDRILLVGLGGGSLPMVLSKLYPNAKIDIVEIDNAVKKVAEDYFHFAETDNMKVTLADARVFVKRMGLRADEYDYILLDAFNDKYIPSHLMTQDFLLEVKQILADDGVLVANTFSSSPFYHHESTTYQSVFGPFLNFKKLENSGNRVIIAKKTALPSVEQMIFEAEAIKERLHCFGVEIEKYPVMLTIEPDWDTSARILTDQFSPVNLLKD